MNEVKILVESPESFFQSALKTARRLDKGDYSPSPASISFVSMEQLLRVLTPNRWVLLRALKGTGASSVRALSAVLRRDYRGVHSDVSVLLNAGLIERQEDGRVLVPWSRITAEMDFELAA
jgi:predicted transcriptional regulator